MQELRDEFKRGNLQTADFLDPVLNRRRHRLMRMTDDATMVGRERRRRLLAHMESLDADGVGGDVVELGVYRGGTAAVLGKACAASNMKRRLWLFDSFEGLPEPRSEDGLEAARYAAGRVGGKAESIGECVGTRVEVERLLFESAQLDPSGVTLVEGWYQHTLGKVEIESIALLHLDCDWYESVQLALETLYERVVPGGWVVLDDYGEWRGARLALHEFLGSRSIASPLHRGGHTQAAFRKE